MSDNNVKNGDIQPLIDCDSWCRTRGGPEAKHKFVWTIERFSQRPEKNTESLDSDIFTIQGPCNMKTQWRIRLFPKCESQEVSDYVSVYLRNETEVEVKVRFELSILRSNRSKQCIVKTAINDFTDFSAFTGWGAAKAIKLSNLQRQSSELLPNDSLTIVCDVTIFGPGETINPNNKKQIITRNLKV